MTREEAIKFYADEILLLELAPTINGDNGSCMKEEWKRQAEIHRLAISALREQPRWIPVTERLPEVGEVALVWDGTFRKVARLGKWGWHEEYLPNDENGGAFVNGVTHWMPLPEPPEVEV